MKISTKKGFTLIELLVVIAIIGILASVVLASLNTARQRANIAKVKAQLSGARASAELYYDQSGGYSVAGNCTTASTMFTDVTSGMSQYTSLSNYPGGTVMDCGSTATAYAMAAGITGVAGSYWCIDSLGNSRGNLAGGGAAYGGLTGAGNAKAAAGGTTCQ